MLLEAAHGFNHHRLTNHPMSRVIGHLPAGFVKLRTDGSLHFVEKEETSTMQERVSNRSRSRGPASMLFMTTQPESEYSLQQAANHISPVQL